MKYIMKVKLFLTCLAFSFICFSVPLFGQKRVVDNAGRLTEAEEAKLEAIATRIASSYNFNFIIVTESREKTGEDSYIWPRYAKSLYDSYGFSGKTDGCLLLVVERLGIWYYPPGRGQYFSGTRLYDMQGSKAFDIEYYFDSNLNTALIYYAEGIEEILSPLNFSKDRRVFDNARCLNKARTTEFEAITGRFASSYNFNLILVTEWDLGDTAPEEYMKNRYKSYGLVEDSDGILLLYTTTPRKCHLYTSGRGADFSSSLIFKRAKDNFDTNTRNSSHPVTVFSGLARDLEEVLSAPPPKYDHRFIDGINRLNSDEAATLEAMASKLASSYGFNFAIVTEWDMGDSMIGRKRDNPRMWKIELKRNDSKLADYAKSLYKRYGFADGSDGCLFYYLVGTDEYCFFTSGKGSKITESIMFKQLEEGLAKKLETRDFYDAYFAFADGLQKIVSAAVPASASTSVPAAASGPTSASHSGKNRLIDDAEILSSDQAQNLRETLDRISETYNFDIVILTKDNIGDAELKDYADDYYNLMGYGIGEEKDGCLFLQVTGSGKYSLKTSGKAEQIFTATAFGKMMTDVRKHLGNNDYNEAYLAIANNCEQFLVLETKGKTFHYSFFELYSYLIVAAVMGLAAGWFAGRPKRR